MPDVSELTKVRPAAVAGRFYPGNRQRLAAEVAKLLAAAPAYEGAAPKAVIAPHAGYVFSGVVAATAFTALKAGHGVTRVIVIGPAHFVPVRGIAIPTVEAFETPLGRVPLDREALASIADLPFVVAADAPHAPDHALEVELPFLQVVLQRFTLVPLIVGAASAQQVAEVLHRLWGDESTLIVVSSDLSHFLDYAAAQRRDGETAAAIERGDWAKLGSGDACGFLPIVGLLIEAERRGLKARRRALCNSGDTAGSRDRVVGYGAWVFAP